MEFPNKRAVLVAARFLFALYCTTITLAAPQLPGAKDNKCLLMALSGHSILHCEFLLSGYSGH